MPASIWASTIISVGKMCSSLHNVISSEFKIAYCLANIQQPIAKSLLSAASIRLLETSGYNPVKYVLRVNFFYLDCSRLEDNNKIKF